MNYAEDFKIKAFNAGNFQSSDIENYLCVFKKKGQSK